MNNKTVGVIFLVLMWAISPLMAKATMKFKETSVNFGEANSGQVQDIKFEFTNSGDSPLLIKDVNSTCGCTVTKMEKMEYAPGESGVIPVRFFTKGYNGRVVKTITVSSNDVDNAFIRLQFTGTVNVSDFADIAIEPRVLNFGHTIIGKIYREKLIIKNPGTIDLRISQLSHTPDLYMVFPKSILAPKESIQVEVVYHPSRPGVFSTQIRIISDALGKNQEMIQVDAEASEI